MKFYSSHNQVYPVLCQGRAAVEKHFSDSEDWRQEGELYGSLSDRLPVPEILRSGPCLLIMGHLPFPHFLEIFDQQVRGGFAPAPWQGLARWLTRCHQLCGKLPERGDLRKFLWDESRHQVTGLDLEGYRPRSLSAVGADLAAQLLNHALGPDAKRAAALIACELQSTKEQVDAARLSLADGQTPPLAMSGIVLAGGLSSRMGRQKLQLPLFGTTLLERQAGKLRAVGIEDILISGPVELELPGTRTVPDEFRQCGPLGGLHACLKAARHPHCLVLGGDVPLVPPQFLAQMARRHQGGVSLLTHQGRWEPLMAVYDTALSDQIPPLLQTGGASVKRLLEQTGTTLFPYLGPEEFLLNCNTPSDYMRICACAEAYRWAGICLP